MGNLSERLDNLKALIQTSDFLRGKWLVYEVNIRIFCYEASEELVVQQFLSRLMSDQSIGCRLIECNLYRVFLDVCADLDILDAVPEMEDTDGSIFLLEQLHSAVGEGEFIEKIQYSPHEMGDVLLLTGVGDVFPFMRVHTLLEALQPYFSDVPILVMYPGEFDGHQLRLFGRLQPSDYYRAFNVI